jgi:hypothetical protein
MAYLAVRGSGAVKVVSRLHGKVSRRIFTPLFPRWPETESACRAGTRQNLTICGLKAVEKTAGWGRREPWSRTFAVSPTLNQGEHPMLKLTGNRHYYRGSYLKNAQ